MPKQYPVFTELEYAIEEAQWNYEQTKEPQSIYVGGHEMNFYVNPGNTSGLMLVEVIGEIESDVVKQFCVKE